MTAATPAQVHEDSASTLVPTAARYLSESRELEVSFGNHFKGRWAVDSLQMLRFGETGWESLPSPTDAELSDVVLWEGKDVVEFPTIDQHYSIPALLRGQLGSKQWMKKISAK
ncbi:MAG: hypothetical protein AAF810_12730 [Cyanobacteria bacterium P01_D01_bin.36]